MQTLTPHHLDLLRHALARLIEEYYSYASSRPDEPTPESQIRREMVDASRPESLVTCLLLSRFLIGYAWEHISLFVKAIQVPIEQIGAMTTIRSMLESCALACWLLDPMISPRSRIERSFSTRHNGLLEYRRWGRVEGEGSDFFSDVESQLNRLIEQAKAAGVTPILDRHKKRVIGLGVMRPSATDLIKEQLGEAANYCLYSAVAHAHHWAIRALHYEFPEESESVEIAGTPGRMGYTRLNIDQLALLAVSCVKAIAKPVIYLELFGGWDVASVKDMLDGAFDTMGIQYSQRFWHDSSDTHLDK